jgi:hypothetical protein
MPVRTLAERILVAFSFAGEQRELVRSIAEAVEARLGQGVVFYDEWFEHEIAGHDGDLKLQKIYCERSALAVVCVSKRYDEKAWTKIEHEAIRARLEKSRQSADKREQNAILPIRVGDGDVEGVLFNTIVPDVRSRPPAKTAELIINRLRLVAPEVARRPDVEEVPRLIYLAESTPDMIGPRKRLKAFLEDLGWTVLPEEFYPESDYRARLETDLHRCRAFVQLLGPYPWVRGGFDQLQHNVAATLSMPCYRYRSANFTLAEVEDPSHCAFLAAPDVIVAGFEDFKVHLTKRLAALAHAQALESAPDADLPPTVLVALRCEDQDSIWEKVFQWLYEREGILCCELRSTESFTMKYQVGPCDGFLVVCDKTALHEGESSPRELLEQCREIQLRQKNAKRRMPPVGLVYWPPPAADWPRLLHTTPLNLHRILGDEPTNLEQYFSEVRKAAS